MAAAVLHPMRLQVVTQGNTGLRAAWRLNTLSEGETPPV